MEEFYKEFLAIRQHFIDNGWSISSVKRDKKIASATFTKNGFSTHILFGCKETIEEEVL